MDGQDKVTTTAHFVISMATIKLAEMKVGGAELTQERANIKQLIYSSATRRSQSRLDEIISDLYGGIAFVNWSSSLDTTGT